MYNLHNIDSEYKVLIAGYDLTKWVIDIPSLPEEKGAIGKVITVPSCTIKFKNHDNIFNPSYKHGFFYGLDYIGLEIEIHHLGDIVWKGFIDRISLNENYLNVYGNSELQKIAQNDALFVIDNKTPAYAAKELLLFYQIKIEALFFACTDIRQSKDAIKCSVRALPDSKITIINLLQQLCDIGLMSIYTENEVCKCIYYNSTHGIIEVSPEHIFFIEIQDDDSNPFDGYVIQTTGGDVGFNKENAKNIKNINAGSSAVVSINNSVTAVSVGEAWLSYTKTRKRKIKAIISNEVISQVNLHNRIRIEGIVYDITRINRKNALFCEVEGIG